jgi:L-Ala-D/L-Glu epimerase / N-acetyl-D-glutamate racemase
MKITAVTSWDSDLGNTKPYTIAFKSIDVVRNVFVEITLENGITGLGSGNPSEYVTGESFESCLTAIRDENQGFPVGRDIRELHQLTHELLIRMPKNPAARAAFDIALYDAFSQYIDMPLVRFLGQKMKSLPTSNTIGIKSVDETVREAKEYIKVGFKILKIKLGKSLEEDIERLVALRENFGKKIILRVDANQGYSIEQTIEFYHKTLELDLELIEQPIAARAVDEMRKLPGAIKERIAADESLLTPSDALDLVRPSPAAGIFNIKLMKCGGISQALKIADIAAAAAIDLFWGCNDESAISIAAALHTAFSCPHTRYIDLDGSLDLSNDIASGGFDLKDGVMYCLDKPGLGVKRLR